MKIEKINDNQIRCTLTSEDLANRQLKLSELAYGTEKAKDLFRDMMLQAQDEFGFEADNIPLMIEAIPITPDSIVLIITKVEDPEELDTRFSKFAPDNEDSFVSQPESPVVTGADDILDLFQKLCESRIKKPADSAPSKASRSQSDSPADAEQKNTPTAEQTATSDKDAEIQEPAPDLTRIFTFSDLDTVIQASCALNGWYTGENTLYKDPHAAYVLILHQSGMAPESFNKVCNILSEYGTGKACSPASEAYLNEHGEVIVPTEAVQHLLLLNI